MTNVDHRQWASHAQAMDRAFRIGQRRNVNVYRLIATGTIEEPMYSRQVGCALHPPSSSFFRATTHLPTGAVARPLVQV